MLCFSGPMQENESFSPVRTRRHLDRTLDPVRTYSDITMAPAKPGSTGSLRPRVQASVIDPPIHPVCWRTIRFSVPCSVRFAALVGLTRTISVKSDLPAEGSGNEKMWKEERCEVCRSADIMPDARTIPVEPNLREAGVHFPTPSTRKLRKRTTACTRRPARRRPFRLGSWCRRDCRSRQ
jgi:hypothetical protein